MLKRPKAEFATEPIEDGEPVVSRRLRERSPWLSPLADVVEREVRLALAVGQPWLSMAPILVVGPPGAGKSHGARIVARHAGCGVEALDLAGMSDNRTLDGTGRGWSNSWPCWPVRAMAGTRSANPILVADEIDKAGGDNLRGGSVHDSVLGMTEPLGARAYYDRCLAAPVDISRVSWLLTANDASGLPAPLRSRLEIVEVAGPSPVHADLVIDGVMADLAEGWRIEVDQLPTLPRSARRIIRDTVATTGSVRVVRRQVRAAVAMLGGERRRMC